MLTNNDVVNARTTLGVDKTSSKQAIKTAYRKTALKVHPDHNSSSDAQSKMQEVNHAYEVLIKTENGTKLTDLDSNDDQHDSSQVDEDIQRIFKFYEFFFKPRQPDDNDVIPEESFQQILRDIKETIKSHEGLVLPGYEKLFGVSAYQIERLLKHSAEFNGYRFVLSDQALRPEVLVCLLRYLSDYVPKEVKRCELDLSSSNLSHPEIIVALKYFLDHAISEWKLTLSKCNLVLSKNLAGHFSKSKAIYALNLSGNRTLTHHADDLIQIIKNNTAIEELNLGDNYFSHDTLSNIAVSVQHNRVLKNVTLSTTKGTCASMLNACLKNTYQLTTLQLQFDKYNDNMFSFDTTPTFITEINPRMTSLHFDGMGLSPKSLQSLLSTHVPNLKSLSISSKGLTDEILISIAAAIKEMPSLEELYLYNATGLHEGQAALLEAVSNHQTLKKLHLPHYTSFGIDDDSLRATPETNVINALENLFKNNKSLVELDMSGCNAIPEDKAKKLAAVFVKNNRTLTEIKVHDTKSTQGMADIRGQVYRNKQLTTVDSIPNLVSEEIKTNKPDDVFFSSEEFNALMMEIDETIKNGSEKFQFKPLPNNIYTSQGRLSRWKDDYIGLSQLEKLMDKLLSGKFKRIDLSKEYFLPPTHASIIIRKIKSFYTNNQTTALTELNISGLNLIGHGADLIAFISSPISTLTKLDISDTKLKTSELSELIKTLTQNKTITDLSIPVSGYVFLSYKSDYLEDSDNCSSDIATMLRANNTLRAVEISSSGLLKNDELPMIVSSLGNVTIKPSKHHPTFKERVHHFFKRTNTHSSSVQPTLPFNHSIESLTLSISHSNADEQLAQVLKTNPAIKQLTLYSCNNIMSDYSKTFKAALNSQSLTHLSLIGYHLESHYVEELDLGILNQSRLSSIDLARGYVHVDVLKTLNEMPLKSLNLAQNRMYSNREGDVLLELISQISDTLESLDLSGNTLGSTHNQLPPAKSVNFLMSLAAELSRCQKLTYFNIAHNDDFTVFDTLRFLHQLRINNPQLTTIKCTIREHHYHGRPLQKHIAEYFDFYLAELNLKRSTNPSWKDLEKSYKDQIQNLLNTISQVIDLKLNGNIFDRLLGSRPNAENIKWSAEHNKIFSDAQNGKYGFFHKKWNKWKLENDDTKVDTHLGLLMDFLDETLSFYADSIKAFHIESYLWASSFKNDETHTLSYDDKLTRIENHELQSHAEFETKMANERAEHENNKRSKSLVLTRK